MAKKKSKAGSIAKGVGITALSIFTVVQPEAAVITVPLIFLIMGQTPPLTVKK